MRKRRKISIAVTPLQFVQSKEEVKQEEPEPNAEGGQLPAPPFDSEMDAGSFKDLTPSLKRGTRTKKKEEATTF